VILLRQCVRVRELKYQCDGFVEAPSTLAATNRDVSYALHRHCHDRWYRAMLFGHPCVNMHVAGGYPNRLRIANPFAIGLPVVLG
jgi:hypothetical protein